MEHSTQHSKKDTRGWGKAPNQTLYSSSWAMYSSRLHEEALSQKCNFFLKEGGRETEEQRRRASSCWQCLELRGREKLDIAVRCWALYLFRVVGWVSMNKTGEAYQIILPCILLCTFISEVRGSPSSLCPSVQDIIFRVYSAWVYLDWIS